MWNLDDVIAAVASAPGAGRRGIVRVSGPGVQSVVGGMISAGVEAGQDYGDVDSSWRPRGFPPVGQSSPGHPEWHCARATRFVTSLKIGGLSTPLPAALYVWPDHRSYAGQPTVEIHTLSSPPILNAIVEELVRRGARVARPGEFTLRAFLAGKIDLVQAEAVLGVIDADSPERLQQALTQLAGGVSGKIRELREELLIDLADLEAGLDFVEEDIEFVDRAAMTERLDRGVEWLSQLQDHASARGQTTGRKTIVLAGLPNAGKSSLFNALVGRDAAVVSPVAGTTRDWLTATIDLGGVSAELVDTAGAEEGTDLISGDAQAARMERTQQADLVLWCTPADATADMRERDRRLLVESGTTAERLVAVQTKADVGDRATDVELAVSAETEAGLHELRMVLCRRLLQGETEGELLSTTLARCSASLAMAHEALARAAEFSASSGGEELVAFELRQGLEALGEIAGVVYTDDLLDRIFSRFCIGK